KIHTPIRSSIGNHEMKICARKLCSSSGFASTLTPYLTRSPTIQMSPGLYVTYRFLSVDIHLIVRPSTLADSTLPLFAESMNSEYDTESFVPWRESNCLTTVSTTRPITSQMPTVFIKLFKRCSLRRLSFAGRPRRESHDPIRGPETSRFYRLHAASGQ